jgi:hypothetical protein
VDISGGNKNYSYRFSQEGIPGIWTELDLGEEYIIFDNLWEGTYLVEVIDEDSCYFKVYPIILSRKKVDLVAIGTYHVELTALSSSTQRAAAAFTT